MGTQRDRERKIEIEVERQKHRMTSKYNKKTHKQKN
jgi:hypothetical protein